MNKLISKLSGASLFTCMAMLPLSVSAHESGKGNAGYVTDINGHVATDGAGRCLRTVSWTPELATAACDPDLVKKAEAEPAPKVAEAPKPAPAPAPQADPEPITEKVTLRGEALFDVGKSEIKPTGKAELEELAAKRKAVDSVEIIRVVGYTDSTGPMAFNQTLSEQRANAVREYLVQLGLNPQRIQALGMGPANPVASNDTSEGRAQNRRVEVEIRAEREVNPTSTPN